MSINLLIISVLILIPIVFLVLSHLKNKTNYFFKFLDKASVGVMIIKTDYTITYYNKTLENMIPISSNKIKDLMIYFEREIGVKFSNYIASLNDNSKPQEFYIKKYHKTLLFSVNSLILEEGQFFILYITDVTKYKTPNISNAQAQKLQEIGRISSSIAHDFNNLLTGMRGFCDILLDKHGKEQSSVNDLMQIRMNIDRSTSLIKQLLDFSSEQKYTSVNIVELIKNLHGLLNKLVNSQINLNVSINTKDNIFVLGENIQIEQIILNLVTNARDAMTSGSIDVLISSKQIDDTFDQDSYFAPPNDYNIIPGSYAVIEIKDTGSGIKRSIIDKIFDPFFSTKKNIGTGIGLATVKEIVEKLNGYIRIKTNLNKGSSFFVFLPILEVTTIKSTNNHHKAQNTYTKNKVIIVDDESSIRIFVKYSLKQSGYEVLDFDNGADALAATSSEISLIIIDYNLQDINGLELANLVKKDYPNIKILITSGYAQNALTEDKSIEFLQKPFSINDLTQKVRNLLN